LKKDVDHSNLPLRPEPGDRTDSLFAL